jgi:hypothetical protein
VERDWALVAGTSAVRWRERRWRQRPAVAAWRWLGEECEGQRQAKCAFEASGMDRAQVRARLPLRASYWRPFAHIVPGREHCATQLEVALCRRAPKAQALS